MRMDGQDAEQNPTAGRRLKGACLVCPRLSSSLCTSQRSQRFRDSRRNREASPKGSGYYSKGWRFETCVMSITWSGAPLLLRIGMTATAHTSVQQVESINQILDAPLRAGHRIILIECCDLMAELMEWIQDANGRWQERGLRGMWRLTDPGSRDERQRPISLTRPTRPCTRSAAAQAICRRP
jgi:hypothetical protein